VSQIHSTTDTFQIYKFDINYLEITQHKIPSSLSKYTIGNICKSSEQFNHYTAPIAHYKIYSLCKIVNQLIQSQYTTITCSNMNSEIDPED